MPDDQLFVIYSGKNVLGQKSELQKALEKHKRAQTQKEIEQQKNSCRTPFEKMIEERAKKIETVFILLLKSLISITK